MQTRRQFLLWQVPAVMLAPLVVRAEDDVVSESDPDAQVLHYRVDVSSIKAGEFPNFEPGQSCANCSHFSPRSGSPYGPCDALRNRLVAEMGWCVAYGLAM